MAAKIKVYIVALEHDNGTRVTVDGYEIDDDVVRDVFSADDDIVRLKEYIIKEILKGARSRGQIRIYTPPAAAPAGDGHSLWQPCKPEDQLVDRQHYGYIDLGARMGKFVWFFNSVAYRDGFYSR